VQADTRVRGVFIDRIRQRWLAGNPLISTDCWKPQARGRVNGSSLVTYGLPIPEGPRAPRNLDSALKLAADCLAPEVPCA